MAKKLLIPKSQFYTIERIDLAKGIVGIDYSDLNDKSQPHRYGDCILVWLRAAFGASEAFPVWAPIYVLEVAINTYFKSYLPNKYENIILSGNTILTKELLGHFFSGKFDCEVSTCLNRQDHRVIYHICRYPEWLEFDTSVLIPDDDD